MSIPRKPIDWLAYDRLPDRRGKDAAFARSIDLTPENFAQYKRTRHRDEPTIEDVPVDTIDLTPPVHVPQKIPLASLCLTAGTQMRESLNLATIAEYADAMSDGAKFPQIVVFTDGDTYWLADGFQRVKAAEQVGYADITADIRPGTLRDAILFACGANSTHGERRTNDDKQKSVRTLLDDAEWKQWSDNRIASVCGVSQPFVSSVRKSLITVISDESNTRHYVDKHGTTTTMHTSNIGKRAPGERKTRPEVQAPPSKVTQKDGWTMYEPPDKPTAPEMEYSTNNDVPHSEEPAPSMTVEDERPHADIQDDLARLRQLHESLMRRWTTADPRREIFRVISQLTRETLTALRSSERQEVSADA